MRINQSFTKNLNIQNLTQRKIAIIGGTGSGKTTTIKFMAYKLLQHKQLKVFVFDPLDVINIPGYDKIKISKKEKAQGQHLGGLINQFKQKKIIFSFKDYLQEEQAAFVNDLFKVWDPKDSMILFDEVHEFVAERGMGGDYSSEVERCIRHARNSNVGFVFDSQRPSFVRKNVLALTDFLILYRVTWSQDVDAVKKILGGLMTKEECDKLIKKIQTKTFLNGYVVDFRKFE